MSIPSLVSEGQVLAELHSGLGVLTLNRAPALNALSLAMIRDLTAVLLAWADDPQVVAVLVRGAGRQGKPAAFCAGGDIRFFHQAALAGDPTLEDFFTEEYALNHLIHHYPKPYIALMDGVVMGGGMGISQGAAVRVVTEHSRLAMPETNIGLFPDVGGGWFLSRCPGHVGEYLALTGHAIGAADAIAFGLADEFVPADRLPALVESLLDQPVESGEQAMAAVRARTEPVPAPSLSVQRASIDRHFGAASLQAIADSLRSDTGEFARETLDTLARRSPLMMAVTLEQLRRARQMDLGNALRLERGLVRRCFHLRPGTASETVEGIRALAIDKDHQPRWNPARIEDVTEVQVAAFFESPWPVHAHPLRHL
ncbi:enoyl-CoA hydratase/isomerase family protein [Ideonella sp. BN130291]|uniref:enoyl-CoA hydratase/isomerase family protein n=1 Tax=Ideonella sp. BN130291 TaxID=3112940 RepID=UPI002E2650B9|nr:enoyl-CoA hydratase/isomerase family protein [Ideonella sp. BN130291]